MELVSEQGENLEVGGVLYTPRAELGRGGYGRVQLYQAAVGTQLPPGAPDRIAVKWVQVSSSQSLADEKSRVRREIENAMALPDHPNICKTYGWQPDEHDATMVRIYMEHVDGPDMLTWAQESRDHDEPTLWHIFQQILEGVLHCHKCGICHRDIKADNVVVKPDGTAKLIDFGLSKNVGASAALSLVGTPAYLPPEIAQADGTTPYDPFKGDAWSLGVALYVIACREYPFGSDGEAGEPSETVLERISTGTWKNPGTQVFGGRLLSARLERCTRPLQGLICRLLTLDPVDRISLEEVRGHPWFYERGVTAEQLALGTGGAAGAEMGTAGVSARQLAELGMESLPWRWDQVVEHLPFDDSMREAVEMAMIAVGESQEMALPVGISWDPDRPAPSEGVPPGEASGGMVGGLGGTESYEMPVLPSMSAGGSWVDELPPAKSWVTEQAFAAAQAAGRPVPHLPKSAKGAPKPAAAWIAGIIYWIADQPGLQALTGLSVTPAADGRPAEFVRQPLASGQSDGDVGQAIAGLIREVLRACGSGLKLQGWNAVSKQLRGDHPNPPLAPGETQIEPKKRKKWWENCYRGGNVRGDHSQTFVELAPELFLMQTILLEKEKPGLLRLATETWLKQNGLASGSGAVKQELAVGVSAEM